MIDSPEQRNSTTAGGPRDGSSGGNFKGTSLTEQTKRFVRGIVSLNKKRFQKENYDLDLAYINDKIIAMGFPSQGWESTYRNPMPEVQRFFEEKYAGNYCIYNLCAEREYNLHNYFSLVKRFPFMDHNPCPLEMVSDFCRDVDDYLAKSDSHVVAVHCKAGKGRTGMMICCYLLHSGECDTAEEVMELFGRNRTHDLKGVTIPSQIRYIYYYEQVVKLERLGLPPPVPKTFNIHHVRLVTVPSGKGIGGVVPHFDVIVVNMAKDGTLLYRQVYSYLDYNKNLKGVGKSSNFVDLDCKIPGIKVKGDVKFIMYDNHQPLFHLWFNTAFVNKDKRYLCFEKKVIDKAAKDKKHAVFDEKFKLEIFLDPTNDVEINQPILNSYEFDDDTDSEEFVGGAGPDLEK